MKDVLKCGQHTTLELCDTITMHQCGPSAVIYLRVKTGDTLPIAQKYEDLSHFRIEIIFIENILNVTPYILQWPPPDVTPKGGVPGLMSRLATRCQ